MPTICELSLAQAQADRHLEAPADLQTARKVPPWVSEDQEGGLADPLSYKSPAPLDPSSTWIFFFLHLSFFLFLPEVEEDSTAHKLIHSPPPPRCSTQMSLVSAFSFSFALAVLPAAVILILNFFSGTLVATVSLTFNTLHAQFTAQ